MPSEILIHPADPGNTASATLAGGAARLSPAPLDCPPTPDTRVHGACDTITSVRGRGVLARLKEAIGVSPSPARVIALVPRGRPSADWPLSRYVDWWLDVGAPSLAPESRLVVWQVIATLGWLVAAAAVATLWAVAS